MNTPKNIRITDYDYPLSDNKIAFFPKEQRDTSKLLVYHRAQKKITDSTFDQLPHFLESNTLLIFNDSKVIHARLLVHNATGAAIEIFCLEPLSPSTELSQALTQYHHVTWKCFVGNAKKWKAPISIPITIGEHTFSIIATKGQQIENAFEVEFSWEANVTFAEWIEAYGKIPLPPYIKRTAEKADEERYQTVYAHYDGSVAAPTAGLHFSKTLLQNIQQKNIICDYITLHVGAGTFKPVKTETIGEHYMHNEQIVIRKELIQKLIQNSDKKIIAVGTTVTRSLESIFIIGSKLLHHLPNPLHVNQWEYYENESIASTAVMDALHALLQYFDEQGIDIITATTQLMIVPSYQFKLIKGIITNFHQPKSTLLLLISAFLGNDWRDIYTHALSQNYRFLSYGDANLYL